MSSQDIINKKKEVLNKLSKRQLKNAIELLTKMAVNLQDWQVSERLNELDTNYKFMLLYQFEGSDDPNQVTVYNGFLRTLYEMTDDITDELLMIESSNFYYEKSRIQSLKNNTQIADYHKQLRDIYDSLSLTELIEDNNIKIDKKRALSVKRERIAADMFSHVFASKRADNEIAIQLSDFFNNKDILEREKCLIISALTLNLCHRFDGRKVQLLMSSCSNENPMISQRAIVGLIIVLQMYDVRWSFYPECKHQLETLSENPYFNKSVIAVIKQLIRSRETEEISRKMTEEIIPEMMKFNSMAGRKLNMEELMSGDIDFSEKNPEWKKELESSGLAGKLQEYSNLQMEGADVFHSTFAHLKNFSFFSEFSNWFIPFDISYSELLDLFNGNGSENLLYSAILNSGHMCNSDKYSFAFSLLQLPESQREMMLRRFGEESEEMKQLQKEAAEMNSSAKDEIISNLYIQDLYRFFKLHTAKKSFFDIFTLRLNFYDKQSIAPLISEPEDMKAIAQYCFDKNFFTEALKIFSLLAEQGLDTSDIWQKTGYCNQMLNNTDDALAAYLQADLLLPDNTWTMKRIAQLYRSKKQPEKALSYYIKIQDLHPDNIATQLNIGHCYLDMKDYNKALNAYFKVELMDGGDNPKAWRPIAWTAFLMKKFDLSQAYYFRILEAKPTVHDFLNAGHTELALNNRKKALEQYIQAVSLLNNNLQEFSELLTADKEELMAVGIKESFFPLLLDQIQYKLD
ncbi:hypothetical protein D0T53_08215 [Dysgonomonas sp. 216]|uniref:tetratricopeptide repeat protein n=1 Tax=Dysgonomonas sp. 216 TaxID=2302934 RepID=UPI0013D18A2D|nr:hypothetical protein [Dysgonomonas sp. 216]NDW18896.1 hypothetical protein [Dysgonomonas sp. 216]